MTDTEEYAAKERVATLEHRLEQLEEEIKAWKNHEREDIYEKHWWARQSMFHWIIYSALVMFALYEGVVLYRMTIL